MNEIEIVFKNPMEHDVRNGQHPSAAARFDKKFIAVHDDAWHRFVSENGDFSHLSNLLVFGLVESNQAHSLRHDV